MGLWTDPLAAQAKIEVLRMKHSQQRELLISAHPVLLKFCL